MRRYRIDFVLTVLTGNLTRYRTLRPLVEADETVASRWFPIRTWVQGDWLRIFPGGLRVRLRHLLDSWRLYVLPPADAVLLHAVDTYYYYALFHRLLRRRTIIVNNPDGGIPEGRSKLARWLHDNAVRRTTLFVPWSQQAADHIRAIHPEVPQERICVLHAGIDLSSWPLRTSPPANQRFRLLFVAGNLLLKGADTLLDAFEQGLSDTCDLDLATQSIYLPDPFRERLLALPHVRLHLDLQPNSAELKRLYAECDAFVLPTNKDTSSWVAIEALATGIPVIIVPQGGIPEIVIDGETGLHIPPRDPAAIIAAVTRLRADPALRERLSGNGRAHIEAHYDARKNTRQLMHAVKSLIDAQRAGSLSSHIPA